MGGGVVTVSENAVSSWSTTSPGYEQVFAWACGWATTESVNAESDPTPTRGLNPLSYRLVTYPLVTKWVSRLSCLVMVGYLFW